MGKSLSNSDFERSESVSDEYVGDFYSDFEPILTKDSDSDDSLVGYSMDHPLYLQDRDFLLYNCNDFTRQVLKAFCIDIGDGENHIV
jgi:hypothetical protein